MWSIFDKKFDSAFLGVCFTVLGTVFSYVWHYSESSYMYVITFVAIAIGTFCLVNACNDGHYTDRYNKVHKFGIRKQTKICLGVGMIVCSMIVFDPSIIDNIGLFIENMISYFNSNVLFMVMLIAGSFMIVTAFKPDTAINNDDEED